MRRSIAVLGLSIAVLATETAAAPAASAGLLPVAVNDSYSAVHGKVRTVAAPGVLANDLQLGGGFTARLVNDVDHGTLDLNGNGSFTYTSNTSYLGPDTFRYRVDGGLLGLSNTATVTINVTNDAPIARPDAYSAVADVEKSIAAPGVLGNDDDADGDDMTIDVVQEPAHGNLNERDDGSFRYKADDGFGGTDTWRYRVTDGLAWSNTVTVTMTVSVPATPKPTPAPTPAPTRPRRQDPPRHRRRVRRSGRSSRCHHCPRSVRCHRSSPGRPLRRARLRARRPDRRPRPRPPRQPRPPPGRRNCPAVRSVPLDPSPVRGPGRATGRRTPLRHPSRRSRRSRCPRSTMAANSNSTPAPSRSMASNGPCRSSS